ncbi:MAG: hypothetical protein ACI3VE_01875 [Oscillospiraceae bacterium]
MKLRIKILLFSFFAFLVLSIIMLICNSERIPVGILSDVSFGMPIRKVEAVLGNPINDYKEANTNTTTIEYQMEVCGYLSDVSLSFSRKFLSNGLSQVYIHIDNIPDTSLVRDKIIKEAYDTFMDYDNFFYDGSDPNCVSLGTDNGATGIYCEIITGEKSIFVYCNNFK